MKRSNICLLLFSTLLVAGGCKKFLSTLPDNRAVITSPTQTSQLLTSAYPHSSYMLFTEAMSDNAEDKGNSPQNVNPSSFEINIQAFAYQDEQSTVGFDLPVTYFDSCYHAIAVANQALVYCNNADSNNYKAQKGEALLCRAYAHFMLVTLFAKVYNPATAATDPGVPYITTPETHVFQTYDRKTVQYDYQMIENDLVRGLPLIDDNSYANAPKFHFTVEAAHAFASRFYLFKQNYAQVVAHSTAVFGGADPSTLIRDQTDYNTLQYADYQVKYTKATVPANILLQETSSFWPGSYPSYRYGYGQNLNVALFRSGNPVHGQYDVITYGATPQYFNFPKFTGGANDNSVLPLLSMEEVLMNRAEANIRLHNYQAATDDLNAWISKNVENLDPNNQILPYDPATNNVSPASLTAYYGLSQDSSMIQAVLDFKRITYLQEGLRWFDILRLHIPVHHTGFGINTTLTANDPRRLLQLPLEAPSEGMPLNPR
jgi:starch-binding outer membrane protein, SusD/RagB family